MDVKNLKIFLTGDNHLGLKYLNHKNSQIMIEERIKTFERMVKVANEEGCNLFVIAGDLFESTRGISKKDIKRLLDILAKFEEKIVILPGNHDFYEKETQVWKYMEDLLPSYDNILLLNEYKPYSMEIDDRKTILYPAFCSSKHSKPGENNLGWIKQQEMPDDDIIRIGIAHGSVEGETIDNEKEYFFMNREELNNINVDCWLLGHTHVPFPNNLSSEKFIEVGKIFNAGTHVQTDVNCNTEGLCFVIDIDYCKKVRAKKIVTGKLHFYRKNIDVTGKSLSEALEELKSIDDYSVVDVNLKGALDEDDYNNRDEVIEKYIGRFIEGTYNDHNISKMISLQLVEKEFAETSFSYAMLSDLLDEPKEAQLVYELLQSLKEDK